MNLKTLKIALLFFIALSAYAVSAQNVEQPTFTAGDTWTLTTIDDWTQSERTVCKYTVLGVVPKFMRVRSECYSQSPTNSTAQKVALTGIPNISESTNPQDLNFIFRVGNQTSTRLFYNWPLSVGKKWDYIYRSSATVITTYTMNAQVVGWESLEIMGRPYRALKIVHTGTWANSSSPDIQSKVEYTLWYSPEFKRAVKYTYANEDTSGMPSFRTTELTSNIVVKN